MSALPDVDAVIFPAGEECGGREPLQVFSTERRLAIRGGEVGVGVGLCLSVKCFVALLK